MMDRLMLLDVDGVLNPWQRSGPHQQAHRLATRSGTFNVLLDPGVGEVLLKLALDVGAELCWATMWDHEANTLLGPLLGLPDLPVIIMDDDYGDQVPGVHPKVPLVARHVRGRPFVWFDDELGKADRLWLKEHPDVGDFRLIHVGGRRGLNSKHLAQAREWFQGGSTAAA
jgi:hypothetical protein